MIERPRFGMPVFYSPEYASDARANPDYTESRHRFLVMGSISEVLKEPGVVRVRWQTGEETVTSTDILVAVNAASYAHRNDG